MVYARVAAFIGVLIIFYLNGGETGTVRGVNGARSLREFCETQYCFVVLSGANATGATR